MPIYEYKCTECDQIFEVLQKINSRPLEKCIHCNGKVEKLISASSFQFKGTGWYITDYKNKKAKTDSSSNTKKVADTKGTKENATIK